MTSSPGGFVSYWLAEIARDGAVAWHGPVTLEVAGTGTLQLALLPNRPNPFRGATRIPFQVPGPGVVRVQVFDARGRRVATLVDSPLEAGVYEAPWNGRGDDGNRVAAGIYFYRLETAQGGLTQKLMVLP